MTTSQRTHAAARLAAALAIACALRRARHRMSLALAALLLLAAGLPCCSSSWDREPDVDVDQRPLMTRHAGAQGGFSITLPRLAIGVAPNGSVVSVVGTGASGMPRQLVPEGRAQALVAVHFAGHALPVAPTAVQLLNASTIVARFREPSGGTATVTLSLAVQGGEFAVVSVVSAAYSVPMSQLDFFNVAVKGLARCSRHLAGAYVNTREPCIARIDRGPFDLRALARRCAVPLTTSLALSREDTRV